MENNTIYIITSFVVSDAVQSVDNPAASENIPLSAVNKMWIFGTVFNMLPVILPY